MDYVAYEVIGLGTVAIAFIVAVATSTPKNCTEEQVEKRCPLRPRA